MVFYVQLYIAVNTCMCAVMDFIVRSLGTVVDRPELGLEGFTLSFFPRRQETKVQGYVRKARSAYKHYRLVLVAFESWSYQQL